MSSKRRGILGSNDAAIAQKIAAQISYMLQLAGQSGARKQVASQMSLLTNVMQKLVYARNDPVRRQSVLDDLARDVLTAEMCIFVPVPAIRQAEGWEFTGNAKVSGCLPSDSLLVCIHLKGPTNKARLQDRALIMEIFDNVVSKKDVCEETQGSLDNQDSFFGTTIAPRHLLGWPVQSAEDELYGALVVQRTSIRPFSKLEKKMILGVAKRVSRYRQGFM